ncbi:MAG: dienelactone hydrolase family protein [Dehalococcoidia bacterium]
MTWNKFQTDAVPTITTEFITITSRNGDPIHAYYARPVGTGPFPGVVLVHHLPGWDEDYLEFTRRFAQHGYLAISPDLYCRSGHGAPDDVAAKVRGSGGVPDAQVVDDCVGARNFLTSQSDSNGKVGLIGTCSGGRHTYVVACSAPGFAAAVDLWGGRVVQDELTENQPVSPITMTKDLTCPLLGIFGNDDQAPSPAQVDQHEAELKQHGKQYEFHRYDDAGHGFWYHDRPAYRPQQAMDSWAKVFDFFGRHLN